MYILIFVSYRLYNGGEIQYTCTMKKKKKYIQNCWPLIVKTRDT